MPDAVICAALRTPVGIGKPDRGELAGFHPVDLGAAVLTGLVEQTGLDPETVDDVIWGCVTQIGEQSANIGRTTALAAGFPESVVGTTVDRQCGSSQQAVHFAAAGLIAGHYDLVIAGGVESMSRIPMLTNTIGGDGPFPPSVMERYRLVPQGISAEMIALTWGLTRDELDAFALESHAKAAAAADGGRFDAELLAIGDVRADQGIRRDTTAERLAALQPAFDPIGVVTAGNSSQISDGAAALLLATSERARELGLTTLARVHSVALAGVDPTMMLTGPIPATEKLLARSGVALAEIDAFEVNEAFASVVLAWLADIGAEPSRVNPNGGAIALGHPLGASGARLMTTLVHHLHRTGGRYGLQTMCEGGGMANATLLERL
jgi:acetyl-CoA acyltransferase